MELDAEELLLLARVVREEVHGLGWIVRGGTRRELGVEAMCDVHWEMAFSYRPRESNASVVLTEVLPLPLTGTDNDAFAPRFLLRHCKYVSESEVTYIDVRRPAKPDFLVSSCTFS